MALIGTLLLMLVLQPCEQVEVVVEDEGEQEAGEAVGLAACRGWKRLHPVFGDDLKAVPILVTATQDRYRALTGRAWWLAAAVVGERVVTQPAQVLRKLEDLDATLAHEMAHLAIRRRAGRNCPRWLDEGLAQYLAGSRDAGTAGDRLPDLDRIDRWLLSASRQEAAEAYRLSLRLTCRLIERVGEKTLLDALPGFREQKDPLSVLIREKPIRIWLQP